MKKKRKVETKYIKARTLEIRALKVMEDYPGGISPSYAASILNENVNTIKSLLLRLESRGKVKKTHRGNYCLVENPGDGGIFSWNFHNEIMICELNEYYGELNDREFCCGPLKFSFIIGSGTKKATLRRLKVDGEELPMNLVSICLEYLFFKELIKQHTNIDIDESRVTLSCLEFNKDYIGLRLDGPNCITLGSLLEQFKIYQKENCVRVEHKFTLPIGMESITTMLRNNSQSIDILEELRQIKETQTKIFKHIKSVRQLINRKNRKHSGIDPKDFF